MIPTEALTDNEQLCPDCLGEKEVAEVRHCTSSTATEPFMVTGKMIPCPTCDSTGVTLKEERRKHPRDHGPLWQRLDANAINLVTADRDKWRATAESLRPVVEHHAAHIDALLVENRRLREAVHKAARTIERNMRATG